MSTLADSTAKSRVNFTQEVRFAVVMYGGSSLAVYMNGVAQELLRMARATAPSRRDDETAFLPDEQLRGSERVYRDLARRLARGKDPVTSELEENAPITTRLVVDILTGTSAGGINAIYLAKALANNQQLDDLMRLWITKGDVGALMNDAKSLTIKKENKEFKLRLESQPASLLNSPRMYWELLDAFNGMDNATAQDEDDPLYAEEIDLYVTTTDTRGRVLRMRLADKVVGERRHRNVFHFRYRSRPDHTIEVNDFTSDYNPFLAYAARCTSAHAAAFEVVSLDEARNVTEQAFGLTTGGLTDDDTTFHKFYEEYLLTEKGDEERKRQAKDFAGRFFTDGGVLDNSPFSFVSDELPFRPALAPIDRKLLYVEPSPEHPEDEKSENRRLGFLDSVIASLSTLPRYQTIVEDLTRILERNRLIQRVERILAGIEEDVKQAYRAQRIEKPPSFAEMSGRRITDFVGKKGTSWGGYQRLRVAEMTDEMSLMIARAAGVDQDSEEFVVIREMVRQWRMSTFSEDPKHRGETEIDFLLKFDITWQMRRIRFVVNRLNLLTCFDDRAEEVAKNVSHAEELALPAEGERAGFARDLALLRQGLLGVHARLSSVRQSYLQRAAHNTFADEVRGLKIARADLRAIHEKTDKEEVKEEIEDLFVSRKNEFRQLTEKVEGLLTAEFMRARYECSDILADPRVFPNRPQTLAQRILFYYYQHFEDYDQISYPIFNSTAVGEETDPVEVLRVSPEDADSLVKERELKPDGRSKLAGTALGHFGAFFDERYRRNDILWGRLDGAERIIAALLPGDGNLRKRLIRQAHEEIIREEFDKALGELKPDRAEFLRGVAQEAAGAGEGSRRELARRLDGELRASGLPSLWRHYLSVTVKEDGGVTQAFAKAFEDSYEEERKFPLSRKVGLGRRAGAVLVKMLFRNIRWLLGGGKFKTWLYLAGLGMLLGLIGVSFLLWGIIGFLLIPFRFIYRRLRGVTQTVGAAESERGDGAAR